MKTKYAIYQNKVGLRAVEYADTKEAIKDLPYIKTDSLPVIINNMGGYTSFILQYEKEKGFVKIIEIDEDEEPLTREQMYPKNSSEFEYGWISPEGDSYNTGHEGHCSAADVICEELNLNSYHGERTLEEAGWVKVTGSWKNGTLEKAIYVKDMFLTKKQADKLFDLGLWEVGYVPVMIKYSEDKW
jgi:hypothetical protein